MVEKNGFTTTYPLSINFEFSLKPEIGCKFMTKWGGKAPGNNFFRLLPFKRNKFHTNYQQVTQVYSEIYINKMFTYNNSKFWFILYITQLIHYTILNSSELLYNCTIINTHIKKIAKHKIFLTFQMIKKI